MMLSAINPHPRDSNIVFIEEGHKYTIANLEKTPVSVTTLIHQYFPEFNADLIINKMMASSNFSKGKYAGKTSDQIKKEWDDNRDEYARLETTKNKDIENYFNGETIENPDSRE